MTLVFGIVHCCAGRIDAHKSTMVSLFALGLVATGLFTLVPGRIMYHVVFGG